MADKRLRKLERRFSETGAGEDEAAWLFERARSGERLDWDSYRKLSELNVEAAAAYLGYRMACGDLALEDLCLAADSGDLAAPLAIGAPSEKCDLGAWVVRLTHFRGWPVWDPASSNPNAYDHGKELVDQGLWEAAYARGKEIQARAGVAIGRLVLPRSKLLYGPPADGFVHAVEVVEVIRALEVWILTPNEQTAERAMSAGWEAGNTAGYASYYHQPGTYFGGIAATFCAGELGNIPDPGPTPSFLAHAAELAVQALDEPNDGHCAEDQVRRAIRSELVPWALGFSDPIRERVEAENPG